MEQVILLLNHPAIMGLLDEPVLREGGGIVPAIGCFKIDAVKSDVLMQVDDLTLKKLRDYLHHCQTDMVELLRNLASLESP